MSKAESDLLRQMVSLQETVISLQERVAELEKRQGVSESWSMKVPAVNKVSEERAKDLLSACTPTQHALIQLVFQGKTNNQIAERLSTTEGSVW